jgi:lysozyme
MRNLSPTVSPALRPASIEALEHRVLFARALGVDVSSYQGSINWTSVKAAGRSFAFIKATEGRTFNSSTFTSQITGAKAAGVLAGAYHFARYDTNTAADEASHFLAVAGKYISAGYLRPVLDVEHSTTLSKTALSNWVNAWCNQVKSATGVAPIVYSYVSYASAHLNTTVTQWPLWMAQYPSSPAPQTGKPSGTSPWTTWSFWQYTDHASVSGISGGVDGDVYNGDLTSLKANFQIAAPLPAPPASPTPANGAAFRTSAPPTLLNWADSAKATSYDVYLDGALKATVATSEWTISGALAYGGHTWSVIARNAAGSTAGPTWNFTIGKFLAGDRVVITNAPSGLKAWNTSASNDTYIVKANGSHATIVGGPVFAQGYWRWQLKYDGDTVARWSAENWLSVG